MKLFVWLYMILAVWAVFLQDDRVVRAGIMWGCVVVIPIGIFFVARFAFNLRRRRDERAFNAFIRDNYS